MKVKFLHSVITLMLLGNLMFTQVVSNFFHTHAIESCSKTHHNDHDKATLQKEEAKCKICSLDLLHDFFYLREAHFIFEPSVYGAFPVDGDTQTANSRIFKLTQRGPPALLPLG